MLHAKREDGATHHREVDLHDGLDPRVGENACMCARVRARAWVYVCAICGGSRDLGLPCKESEAEHDDDRHAHGYENRIRLIPSEHGPTVPQNCNRRTPSCKTCCNPLLPTASMYHQSEGQLPDGPTEKPYTTELSVLGGRSQRQGERGERGGGVGVGERAMLVEQMTPSITASETVKIDKRM